MPIVFKPANRKRWHYKIKVNGQWRSFTGFTDKQATSTKASQHEQRVVRGEVGLVDPCAEHKKLPLKDHLASYLVDMRALGRDAMHIYNTDKRLHKLAVESGWNRTIDITVESFSRWRSKAEVQKLAPKTRNEYLSTAQTFCRWCVSTGRMVVNPLQILSPVKTNGDIRRQRRAFTDEELERLLAVSAVRRPLYLTAALTGLRRGELRQLQWGDVHLDSPKPYLDVRANTTKNGKRAIIWLRDDVADALRTLRLTDAKIKDGVFAELLTKQYLDHFKSDLTSAKIERTDKRGRILDFHCLRHTLATNLSRAGVPPRIAMEIMRHGDMRLTMQAYTDSSALPTADALEYLPRFNLTKDETPAARTTGTADAHPTIPKIATTGATKIPAFDRTSSRADAQTAPVSNIHNTCMNGRKSDFFHPPAQGDRNSGQTGGLGFEPRQTDSESAVLPLHHPPRDCSIVNNSGRSDKRHAWAMVHNGKKPGFAWPFMWFANVHQGLDDPDAFPLSTPHPARNPCR